MYCMCLKDIWPSLTKIGPVVESGPIAGSSRGCCPDVARGLESQEYGSFPGVSLTAASRFSIHLRSQSVTTLSR